MKDEYFNVSPDSRIAIYSAGLFGRETVDKLKERNYEVCCIIDRNPVCCEYKNIPVISVTEIELLHNIEDLVFFICLRNGLLHEDIARILYGYGVNKIIYLPDGKSLDKMHRYRQNYRFMTMGEFENMSHVPVYFPEKSQYIICETNKSIVFWCSCEDLYIQKKNKNNPWEDPEDYIDIKVRDADYYFNLFYFLRGGVKKKDVMKYMMLQGYHTEAQQEECLSDRMHLYETYENAMKYDPYFFADSPAKSVYRKENTLYILDGVHRTVYLMLKGYDRVPVQVKKEDYFLYCVNGGALSCTCSQ